MKCRKPALEKCESNKECSPLFFCNEYHICDDSPDKTPYIDYVFFFFFGLIFIVIVIFVTIILLNRFCCKSTTRKNYK